MFVQDTKKHNQLYTCSDVENFEDSDYGEVVPHAQKNNFKKSFKNAEVQNIKMITPKTFITIISFMQGIYSVANLSLFYYQKDTLSVHSELMQIMVGMIALPWGLKPLFGFIYDQIIKKIKKGKYIVIINCILRMFIFGLLATIRVNTFFFYFLMFINSLLFLFENLFCESFLVKSSKQENKEKNKTNSNHLPIFFGFKAAGRIIGTYFGGRFVLYYSNETIFLIIVQLCIIPIVVCLFYQEKDIVISNADRSLMQEFKILKDLLFRDKIIQLIGFMVLINMTPSFDQINTFYMTDILKFNSKDLANFDCIGTICYIMGLILYSYYFKEVHPKPFYVTTNFLLWIINVSFLLVLLDLAEPMGISNKLFCFFNQGFYSLIAELNMMPVLSIWCDFCPDNLEASSIALFTGLLNLSGTFSNYLGSAIQYGMGINSTCYDKIWILNVIQNVYLIFMVVGVAFIDFPVPKKTKNEQDIEMNQNYQTVDQLNNINLYNNTFKDH